MINAYRARFGVPPLKYSADLSRAALWKSYDMAYWGYLDHDDSFRGWQQRLSDCGYNPPGANTAENIESGDQTADGVFREWQGSEFHNQNMLDPGYGYAGLKRSKSPNPNDPFGWYWTLDLGSAPDPVVSPLEPPDTGS
jgi:uncharacterized protein YkwD